MITNNPTEIQVAFELLQEAIEVDIDLVNKAGSKAFESGDYKGAREAIERAEQMAAFRDKVIALRKEWEVLIPAYKSSEEKEIMHAKRRNLGRLQRGLRTPEAAYYRSILIALEEAGGTAETNDVLTRVGTLMKDSLKRVDYEPLSSRPELIRWNHTARWARQEMVEKGLLKSDSQRGVWEITEAGRQFLKEGQH
jgi:restriction system protein